MSDQKEEKVLVSTDTKIDDVLAKIEGLEFQEYNKQVEASNKTLFVKGLFFFAGGAVLTRWAWKCYKAAFNSIFIDPCDHQEFTPITAPLKKQKADKEAEEQKEFLADFGVVD